MSELRAEKLLCEYAENPLGLDVIKPRFSWQVISDRRGAVQSSYRVLISSSRENLDRDIGEVWDSGKVICNRSVNVLFEGKTLESRGIYYWKVQIRDDRDSSSGFSEVAHFEMGLLNRHEWHGEWIGPGPEYSGPLLRRGFTLNKGLKSGRLYFSGLGLSELYINGKRVGDQVLDPVLTDYRLKVPYRCFDVTDFLYEGKNILGVMLGNGWYRGLDQANFQHDDTLKMLLQLNLTYEDGNTDELCSDTGWKFSSGPIRDNSLQMGEIYDARLEQPGWSNIDFDDSSWCPVLSVKPAEGELFSQSMEAMEITETLSPREVYSPESHTWVVIFNRLFSGWSRIRFKGRAGTKVSIAYSSRFTEERRIDKTGGHGPVELDEYTLKGDLQGEYYEPRFTFHPVQYMEISGEIECIEPNQIEGRVVSTAVDIKESFHCSYDLFNRIHKMVTNTLVNAMKGFPMDCLNREPLGYNEPASVSSILFSRKFMPRFWLKWLDDIRLGQRSDGYMSDWAPELPNSNREHDVAQLGNYPAMVWYLYEALDDIRIIEDHYPAIARWIGYLGTIEEDGLIKTGWLGDHMLPGKTPGHEVYVSDETPRPLVWNGYYYKTVLVASRAARLLGREKEADEFQVLAGRIKRDFNKLFFDEENNRYAEGAQTANGFSLILGLVPGGREEKVAESLVYEIMETHKGHIHTGHAGTSSVLEALIRYEKSDPLYALASAEDYPGWGYMLSQGATTVWESWGRDWAVDYEGGYKHHRADNMMMWGSIDKVFLHYVAGISEPAYNGDYLTTPGYQEISIKPHPIGGLTHGRARIDTVKGPLSSRWRKEGGRFYLNIEIPGNCRATVVLPRDAVPSIQLSEGGVEIIGENCEESFPEGIYSVNETPRNVEIKVGSGSYSFCLLELKL